MTCSLLTINTELESSTTHIIDYLEGLNTFLSSLNLITTENMSDPSFPVPTSFQVSNGGSQEEEKKVGYVNYEVEPGFTIRLRQNIDPAMDPKKLRRSGYII